MFIKEGISGKEPKDLEFTLSDGILILKGDKKREGEEEGASCPLTERSYGIFSRAIQLPTAVQSDQIHASYKNGVLQIVLPKSEEARTRRLRSTSNNPHLNFLQSLFVRSERSPLF